MAARTRQPWTAEELNRLPEGWRYEIDEGELVILPLKVWCRARLGTRISCLLHDFVHSGKRGEVLISVGVLLRRDPDTLRTPDVAFYSNERAARIRDEKGFPNIPPELAVEVRDPSEDLPKKIRQYLEAGVRAVWVVDPEARTLTRHAPGEEPCTWAAPYEVVEEPVLPGFACRLVELFGEG